jgi:hypothetical protein
MDSSGSDQANSIIRITPDPPAAPAAPAVPAPPAVPPAPIVQDVEESKDNMFLGRNEFLKNHYSILASRTSCACILGDCC